MDLQKTNPQDEKINNLKISIAFAFERTRSEPFDITQMVRDISLEFHRVPSNKITEAIRNGSLGKYGRTFRLSTQEVCFWIREHIKPIKQDKL
jgi:hypothetical protein